VVMVQGVTAIVGAFVYRGRDLGTLSYNLTGRRTVSSVVEPVISSRLLRGG